MTFLIDIDDTILYSKKEVCKHCGRMQYKDPKSDMKEIAEIKKLYEHGHTIILFTGRNWDCYKLTVEQLKNNNVLYHQLVMGKPQGHYIDKDSYKTIGEALNVINSDT